MNRSFWGRKNHKTAAYWKALSGKLKKKAAAEKKAQPKAKPQAPAVDSGKVG